jgi:hypothetical protein
MECNSAERRRGYGDQELWGLSEMIQWIWEDRIRVPALAISISMFRVSECGAVAALVEVGEGGAVTLPLPE